MGMIVAPMVAATRVVVTRAWWSPPWCLQPLASSRADCIRHSLCGHGGTTKSGCDLPAVTVNNCHGNPVRGRGWKGRSLRGCGHNQKSSRPSWLRPCAGGDTTMVAVALQLDVAACVAATPISWVKSSKGMADLAWLSNWLSHLLSARSPTMFHFEYVVTWLWCSRIGLQTSTKSSFLEFALRPSRSLFILQFSVILFQLPAWFLPKPLELLGTQHCHFLSCYFNWKTMYKILKLSIWFWT